MRRLVTDKSLIKALVKYTSWKFGCPPKEARNIVISLLEFLDWELAHRPTK